MGFISWLANKVASEVHKSKIEEFEKRIAEMESKHEVILKTLKDHDDLMNKMEDRMYESNMKSSQAIGAIKTAIQTGLLSNNHKSRQDEK